MFTKPLAALTDVYRDCCVEGDKGAEMVQPWMNAVCTAKKFAKEYREYKKCLQKHDKISLIFEPVSLVPHLKRESLQIHPTFELLYMKAFFFKTLGGCAEAPSPVHRALKSLMGVGLQSLWSAASTKTEREEEPLQVAIGETAVDPWMRAQLVKAFEEVWVATTLPDAAVEKKDVIMSCVVDRAQTSHPIAQN